jgi:hypothetical protein
MAERNERGRDPERDAGSGLREAWRELRADGGRDADWPALDRGPGPEGLGGGFAGDYSGISGFGGGVGAVVGGRGHGTSGSGTGTGYGGGYGANSRYGDDEQGREVWSEREEGPYTGRGPQGYQRSDDRIHEDVSEALTRHGHVDATGIFVRVENGEVTLEGNVNSRREKRLAVDAVHDLPGVKDVHNRLRIAGQPGAEGSDATKTRGAEAAGSRQGGPQTENQASGASQSSGEGPGRSRKGFGTT